MSSPAEDVPEAFEQWCPDASCYSRVSVQGPTVGMQLEPKIRQLSGTAVAERLMACNDVAYLSGRLRMRRAFEQFPGLRSVEGMETEADLAAARRRLQRFAPSERPEQR